MRDLSMVCAVVVLLAACRGNEPAPVVAAPVAEAPAEPPELEPAPIDIALPSSAVADAVTQAATSAGLHGAVQRATTRMRADALAAPAGTAVAAGDEAAGRGTPRSARRTEPRDVEATARARRGERADEPSDDDQEPSATRDQGQERLESPPPEPPRREESERPSIFTAASGVDMALTEEDIRRIVLSRQGDLRRCYERGLARDPSLLGRAMLEISIDSEGSVTEVDLVENELNRRVGTCITGAIERWEFRGVDEALTLQVPYWFEPVDEL